jgi:hypothetical protein
MSVFSGNGGLHHRAVIHACAASGAQIGIDGAGALAHFDFEFSGFAFYGFKIRIGDKLNIQMPADLDQYG